MIAKLMKRMADALDRMAPAPVKDNDFTDSDAFVWQAEGYVQPVTKVNRVELELLKAIDRTRDILLENTSHFAKGFSANNVLLWGARGMGKSSLIKAVHAKTGGNLKLVEIHREDIETLPQLMRILRQSEQFRFIVFCDDLSFDGDDTSYKSLKAALDGGIEGRPENVLFYATSNRRHLIPRNMMENERSTAINPSEAIQEKVSLSDRFGLWLGFHQCSQDEYLQMVEGYIDYYKFDIDSSQLRAKAIEWAATRGSRSGRVAWQFVVDLAGQLGRKL